MPAALIQAVGGSVVSPNSVAAKRACSSGSDSTEPLHHGVSLRGFRLKDGERRNVRIPFNERWPRTEALQRHAIELPNLGCDVGAMRIDANVAPATTRECVAGQMKFLHRGRRNAIQVAVGVKTMVHGIDVEVVDVQQYAAAGFAHERRQELPFGDFGAVKLEVTRDV